MSASGCVLLKVLKVGSPDLRARFVRSELALFRHRFETDDVGERQKFLQAQNFDWHQVSGAEKAQHHKELRSCMPPNTRDDAFNAENWFKAGFMPLFRSVQA